MGEVVRAGGAVVGGGMMEKQLTLSIMTYEQALDWEKRLCHTANEFRDLLNEGHKGEAWKALGYASFTQHLHVLADRLGFSANYAWRELKAAQIEENLLDNCQVENNRIPESHLRPLSGLEPGQQREAWQEAIRTAPNGRVTGAHVARVVRGRQELPKAMVYERVELQGGVVACSRCKQLYDGRNIEYCPYCAYTSEQRVQHLEHEREKAKQQVHYSSETPEWYTPEHIITRVIGVMGEIDLDPCSNDKDNPNVPAKEHYTQADDGTIDRSYCSCAS
jgi:hypothetical protein